MSKSTKRSALLASGLGAAVLLTVAANGAVAAPTPAPKPTAVTTVAQKNAACPTTPGVTPTSVSLAWIGPKTGAASANYLGSSQAAQLRIDQENAKGGVNGRKLTLKVYDDASNPSTQIAVANQAIQQDNVFGATLQSSTVSAFPTFKAANFPITGFANPPLQTDRNTFSPIGVPSPAGLVATNYLNKLKSMGVTKLANINHASAGASLNGNNTSKLVPFVDGLTEVLRISDEPQGSHDATSTALRIKKAGADGAILVGYIEGGVSIAQALKQQGVDLKGLSIVGLSDPSVLKSLNGALEGAIGTTYGTTPIGVNKPAVKTFAAGMKAAGLNPYASAAPMGYLGADLLIKGLKVAGQCPTRDAFVNNLRNVTNYDGGGLVPEKISFKPGLTPNGNPATCTWFMTVKGTDLVPDKAATCGFKYIDTATGKVVLG